MAFSELLVDALTAFIEDLGLLGIFLTMAAESCLIPIPSEVVMPFAGYVAWLKSSELFLGYSVAAATIGNLLGSTILYYIGLRLGKAFIEKYGKYFLLRRREVELAERWFLKYGGYAVFFGRMTPAIRTVISLPAGLFEFDFKKFAVLTLIGSIPWNLFLVYLGYLSGPYWKMILEYSTFVDAAALIGLAAFLLLIFWKTRRNPPKKP